MNSIERITASLNGEPTDRRAISPILPLYGARLTDCELSDYYNDASAYTRAQSAILETFEPDVLFGPFALPLEGAAFGSEVRFFDNQAPNLVKPAIGSVKEMDRLAVPDVDRHPRLLYFRETIRQMHAEHGHKVPIAPIASGPIDLPAMILGIEGWLDALLFNKEDARQMLNLTIDHSVRFINALFSEGAMFVAIPVDFANPRIILRKTAIEVTIPALKEALSHMEGPIFLHSGGAPLAPAIDLLANLPNVAGFVLNGSDSFAEARKRIGPQPVLVGNIEGPSLFMRKKEDIREECLAALHNRRNDPHFVLGTSMADIGINTPPENIHVLRESAEHFAGLQHP